MGAGQECTGSTGKTFRGTLPPHPLPGKEAMAGEKQGSGQPGAALNERHIGQHRVQIVGCPMLDVQNAHYTFKFEAREAHLVEHVPGRITEYCTRTAMRTFSLLAAHLLLEHVPGR